MRPFAVVLLASGLAALSGPAWPQAEPPATADDYVCEFTGDCAEEAAPEEPNATGNRPRISASRGFALSGRGSSGTAGPAPSTPPRRTVRRPGGRPAGPGQRVNLRLSFETGSAVLTAAARAQAETFAQALQRPQLRSLRFQIEGHTDSVGSRASNIALSQRRAQSVADFLAGKGVERSRLAVRGYGPDRPLPGLRASAGENRRVEAVRIN